MVGVLCLAILITFSVSSVISFSQLEPTRRVSSSLLVKKKKPQAGTGFGKVGISSLVNDKQSAPTSDSDQVNESAPATPVLRSVEQGGSRAKPTFDDSLSPEERAKKLLKDQYGLKTLEEKQAETKREEMINKQRQKLKEWKNKADEDFDIMAVLPPGVIRGIDTFLKAGVLVTGVLFILAGLGITVEAWSKSTGNALPENVDSFITGTVEPNFTPGLLVLLGFSISLGIFATAQLGSAGAQYRERGD